MYFRHAHTLWSFKDAREGILHSPLIEHSNPRMDDAEQEFLLLFELENSSKSSGSVFAWTELGALDLWLPSAVASDGYDEHTGEPVPFKDLGPHGGILLLVPGMEKSEGEMPLRTFSIVPPQIRFAVVVDGGEDENRASGRFVLLSNGPISSRELR